MPPAFVSTALGSAPVARLSATAFRRRLRVLAYHDVPDAAAFEQQVAHLVERYRPVSAADVVAAVEGDARLPERAVWVTFDDGFADVVEHGLPVLDRHGVPATLFVCPAAVERGRPLWFDRARAALAAGWRPPGSEGAGVDAAMRALKAAPDARRRALLEDAPEGPTRPVADEAALRRWVDAGHHLGNHTWDHPCLDTCEPPEQRRQVVDGRRWLDERFPGQPPVFAYPNGDWAAAAEAALDEAGERVALLFDHRLGRPADDPRRMSRLRVSSDAPLDRFRGIVSGAHPLVFALGRRGQAPASMAG